MSIPDPRPASSQPPRHRTRVIIITTLAANEALSAAHYLTRRSAEEGEMNTEQFEFVMAIETYKKVNRKLYPTWTEILEIVRDLNRKERVSFLLAEQNTTIALRYADYGYILENGRVVMDGTAEALSGNEDVQEFYLGMGAAGRLSFRDAKHYRRRKRWLA